MELSWHRFETHRSPKGHGMRARARGKTFEGWQDASGRWRMRSTDRPQDKPDFSSWPEARAWAEKRASANPAPAHNPQSIHKGPTMEPNPSRADAARLVDLSRGGYKAYLKRPVVLSDDDGIVWSGTLKEFLESNDELDPREVVIDLHASGAAHFGGGATPATTLRFAVADPTRSNPASKVDAHAAHQLRLFIDGSSDLNSPMGNDEVIGIRRGADEVALDRLQKKGSLSDAVAEGIYEPVVQYAYKVFRRRGGVTMNKDTRRYVARELGEDVAWEHRSERSSTNPPPWRVVSSRKISSGAGGASDFREWTIVDGRGREAHVQGRVGRYKSPARVKGQPWAEIEGPPALTRETDIREAIENAIVAHESANKRLNPIACGSRIGKKDCRQLQHVYESAKKRGLSDERAAKSAWGSLERNPDVTLATAKRWLAIRNSRTTMTTKNPAKGKRGEVGEAEARELELYIDNDEPLYRKWQAIVKNLWGHRAKGRYNHDRAVDGFMYLVDDGAKKYAKEFASPSDWNKMFDSATRRHVAEQYATSFENNERDEIEYAPANARQNPRTRTRSSVPARWSDVTAIEVYDKLNDKMPVHVRADDRGKSQFEKYIAQYGSRHDQYVVQALDIDGEIVVDNQGGEGGEIRHFPKRRHNPLAAFDKLTADEQSQALQAYAQGLEAGATRSAYETTSPFAAFVEAGYADATAVVRARNPGDPPKQVAWVVIEGGKPTGLFFAPEAIDRAAAARVPVGPAGRRRNGAGLGAFLGSLVGSVLSSAIASVGAMPLTAAGGLAVAPLALLISAAGGAIGGHMGASSKSKKRGAIGGGVGGLFGPLGAALGGYIGGRKPDRKSNPRARAMGRRITA